MAVVVCSCWFTLVLSVVAPACIFACDLATWCCDGVAAICLLDVRGLACVVTGGFVAFLVNNALGAWAMTPAASVT